MRILKGNSIDEKIHSVNRSCHTVSLRTYLANDARNFSKQLVPISLNGVWNNETINEFRVFSDLTQ